MDIAPPEPSLTLQNAMWLIVNLLFPAQLKLDIDIILNLHLQRYSANVPMHNSAQNIVSLRLHESGIVRVDR